MRPLRRPEVVAPAGDLDAMRAAVRGGADAVYFGLEKHNARARAKNFRTDDLERTMRELHGHGVRGYVALNTLAYDDELAEVETMVRACAAAGADAIIVQDLGVARLVGSVAPGMPMHASTQMTCTDRAALEVARDLGARRVILPRELSLSEIASLAAEALVELEVFVHGALCISYSGQCLASRALGERSANRGDCAQPCRLPYELLVDGVKRDLGARVHLLSPHDLDALSLVPELVRLGVAGLKIEGRMKGPDYVRATSYLYKKAVLAACGDAEAPSEQEHALALQAYSRGSGTGFLLGVDHQKLVDGRSCDHRGLRAGTCLGAKERHGRACLSVRLEIPLARGDGIVVEDSEIGGRVWALFVKGREVERADANDEALVWLGPDKPIGGFSDRRHVYKTSDPGLGAKLDALPSLRSTVSVHMTLTGSMGEAPRLLADTSDGRRAEITLDTQVEAARSQPLTPEAIRGKLGRLGDTPFALAELSIDLPSPCAFAVSALNRARRAVVAELIAQAHPARSEAAPPDPHPLGPPPPPGLFVLCRTLEQARAALEAGATGVYLDFPNPAGLASAIAELRARHERTIGVALPRVQKPGDRLAALEPDLWLVRSLGALATPCKAPRIGDASLNVTNRISAGEVLSRGLAAFTPGHDLDAARLAAMMRSPLAPFAEIAIHHAMPLFYMEYCLYAAHLSKGSDRRACGRPCERHRIALGDRKGREHVVVVDAACRSTVFCTAERTLLRDVGARRWRVELLGESAEATRRIVRDLY